MKFYESLREAPDGAIQAHAWHFKEEWRGGRRRSFPFGRLDRNNKEETEKGKHSIYMYP